jgi:hypothetical protein
VGINRAKAYEQVKVVLVEDDFSRFVRDNWAVLGLTPVILRLLVEHKGWWMELVDECFRELVGEDYADIKLTEWIERLEEKGYEFPDGKPVIATLSEILIEAWSSQPQEMPHAVC